MTRPNARRVPRATYRIQLHPRFGFADAANLVGQLTELGISHLYLSPALEAVSGSTHGYDVVDPTRIRAELGGEEGLRALAGAAHDAGLGLVLDIVPNHVGVVSPDNAWWWDVLAHGPDARFGRHLDVHWRTGAHGQPTLLLPQLGAPLEDEIDGDELRLDHADDPARPGWRIVYHEHAWPVRPGSMDTVGLDATDVAGTLDAVRRDRSWLRALLEHQHYRLAHWRRANDELDHRRFFDIHTLGAARVEDPAVFADVHAAVLPLLDDGTLDGLRIDHPDGLRDPLGYFERLRAAAGDDVWIVVEKILERGERLRPDWPVDGTVGYELADLALGVHVDPAAAVVFDDLHATLTGERTDRDVLHDAAKREALTTLFGAERRRLAAALSTALGDVGPAAADEALTELLAAWPVYRTYVRPDPGTVAAEDHEVVDRAVGRVRARRPDLGEIVDRVRRLLMLADRSPAGDDFVWAFQQLTGPVVAKGLEDTVLYRDLRFVAVNEVGGDPTHLGRDVGELHTSNADVQTHRPATMRLSSSHDTKRSEDVRARLAVLSQDPDGWVRAVLELRGLTAPHRGARGPSPAHEHLFFQTVVGTWPIDAGRLTTYLVKAAREGKQDTNWLDPDTDYEADLDRYVGGALGDPACVAAIERIVDDVREAGWLTSLAMTLTKLAAPGVPDVYQGCELWDLSLVDPDNRRPIDHALRARLLDVLDDDPAPEAVLDQLDDGLPKLWLIRQALALRAERPAAFGADAAYVPLWPSGRRADRLAAWLRGDAVAALVPVQVRRLGRRFTDWDWDGTMLELPAGTWHDRLTGVAWDGGTHRVADLLGRFPVALLTREA